MKTEDGSLSRQQAPAQLASGSFSRSLRCPISQSPPHRFVRLGKAGKKLKQLVSLWSAGSSNGYDLDAGIELVQNLPAGAARKNLSLARAENRDRPEILPACRDCIEHGGALRAASEAERNVLDVGSLEYLAVSAEEGAAESHS